VWVTIEPIRMHVLGVYLSYQRNIMVPELFLISLVKTYGRHAVYTDEGVRYPDAGNSLGLERRIHFPYEKSLIERGGQSISEGQDGKLRRSLSLQEAGLCPVPRLEVAVRILFDVQRDEGQNQVQWTTERDGGGRFS